MIEKIKHCLTKSGLETLPSSPTTPLADFGLDSLQIVLLVLQLEAEFAIKIPADQVLAENFVNLESIHNLVQQQCGLKTGGHK